MEATIFSFKSGKGNDKLKLSDDIFGVEPREDILHRVVMWQLNKRRAGTHAAKQIQDVSGTSKKPFKQKHTGNARQGSLRSPHMRGGAASVSAPRPHSHETYLNKKIRTLGLKMALSDKAMSQHIVIVKDLEAIKKTTEFIKAFEPVYAEKALFVDADKNELFLKAIGNAGYVNLLPVIGLNVYDIMRHDTVFMTQAGYDALLKRLGA